MSDTSRHASDITAHPDVAEMRERYARMVEGPKAIAVDGLILLAGLYCAVSPFVVHFFASDPFVAGNDVITGLILVALGFALTASPARLYRLSWVAAAIGVWLIISPWVLSVGQIAPTNGVIWNNVLIGAVTCLLGLIAVGMVLSPIVRRLALRR